MQTILSKRGFTRKECLANELLYEPDLDRSAAVERITKHTRSPPRTARHPALRKRVSGRQIIGVLRVSNTAQAVARNHVHLIVHPANPCHIQQRGLEHLLQVKRRHAPADDQPVVALNKLKAINPAAKMAMRGHGLVGRTLRSRGSEWTSSRRNRGSAPDLGIAAVIIGILHSPLVFKGTSCLGGDEKDRSFDP